MSGRSTRRAASTPREVAAMDPSEVAFSREAQSTRRKYAAEVLSSDVHQEDKKKSTSRKKSSVTAPIIEVGSPTPVKKKASLKEDHLFSSSDEKCSICLEDPAQNELAKVDKCAHLYCFSCIEKWAERENSCPLCKTRFTKIERVHKTRAKRKAGGAPSIKNTKRVKKRDQKSDLPFGGNGNVLEMFLSNLERREIPSSLSQIIFSAMNNSTSAMASRHGAPRYTPEPPSDFILPTTVMFGNMLTSTSSVHAPFSPQDLRRSARLGFDSHENTADVRSYAINGSVANAGMSIDIPLEIADSDDEVVEVSSPPSQTSTSRVSRFARNRNM